MRRTPALVRLERKLSADRGAILNAAEIRLFDQELRRTLVASFPGLPAHALNRTEDTIRWHTLGAQCAHARGARGIRDISAALAIPQYRLRAIESGRHTEICADLARRYFRFLGIEAWVTRWCRANRDLATRVGLLDITHDRRGRQRRRA